MGENSLNNFLALLNRHGHRYAHLFTGNDYGLLCYLSPLDSYETNIQKVSTSLLGGFYYSDDSQFSAGFSYYIQANLIRDEEIFSDLFGGQIRFMVYNPGNQDFKFIYEYSSILNLKLL